MLASIRGTVIANNSDTRSFDRAAFICSKRWLADPGTRIFYQKKIADRKICNVGRELV